PPTGYSMPRRSVMRETLARPARCRTPLLRPPSTYSPTSISRSSPVHSAKAPSVRGVCPLDDDKVTLNLNVRASRAGPQSNPTPGCKRRLDVTLGLQRHADDDELQRFGRRDPDLDDQLSGVCLRRRVGPGRDVDEPRLVRGRSGERPEFEQVRQHAVQLAP